MTKQEFENLIGFTTAQECYERIEYVYTNCPFFSNTNGKTEIAQFYKLYDMNGIERLYRETLKIEKDKAQLKKAIRSTTGTQMAQEEYLKLEKSTDTALSDAEAKILINSEFGFEVSRIDILTEAELNMTEDGSRYLTFEKISRIALHSASDWNYIRFNIRTGGAVWYYEMINSFLHQINI